MLGAKELNTHWITSPGDTSLLSWKDSLYLRPDTRFTFNKYFYGYREIDKQIEKQKPCVITAKTWLLNNSNRHALLTKHNTTPPASTQRFQRESKKEIPSCSWDVKAIRARRSITKAISSPNGWREKAPEEKKRRVRSETLPPPKKRVEIAASGEVSSQKKKTRHEKVYFSQDKKKLTWLESHLTIGANHLTFSDLPPAHTLMRVLHSGQRGRGEMRDRTHFRAISLYAPVQNCSAMAVADNYSLSKHIYLFIFSPTNCSTPTELCNIDLFTFPTLPPHTPRDTSAEWTSRTTWPELLNRDKSAAT